VRATANINQLRADYTSPVDLRPLDADGQIFNGVTVQPETVRVRVPIRSVVGLRRVAVLVNTGGLPAPGYVVSSVSSDPPLVNLTGSSGPLDEVNQIETEPVDISGATRTITREVALLPPPGTSLQSGEPARVVVTVGVEPVSRPFRITLPVPVQVVDIGAGLLVSLSPQAVDVSLTGSSAALASLSENPPQATVSAISLGPGSYELTPQLSLPPGVQVEGEVPQVTVGLRFPPASTPQPTRTSEPDETPTPSATPPDGEPTLAPTPEAATQAPAAAATPTPAP
jgi:YbbR domain-containing protein